MKNDYGPSSSKCSKCGQRYDADETHSCPPAPHPEQNTQRPNESESAPDVPLKSPLPLIKDATRADIQPAPQTEAGDVEAAIYQCAALILEPHYDNSQGASFQKDVERAGKYIREGITAPLTQRIAELEKEFAIEKRDARQNFTDFERAACDAIRERKRAEAAEARVKELEQKLAGALKVTTENTIAHMQGKP